jgi:hypothetical protein
LATLNRRQTKVINAQKSNVQFIATDDSSAYGLLTSFHTALKYFIDPILSGEAWSMKNEVYAPMGVFEQVSNSLMQAQYNIFYHPIDSI